VGVLTLRDAAKQLRLLAHTAKNEHAWRLRSRRGIATFAMLQNAITARQFVH